MKIKWNVEDQEPKTIDGSIQGTIPKLELDELDGVRLKASRWR